MNNKQAETRQLASKNQFKYSNFVSLRWQRCNRALENLVIMEILSALGRFQRFYHKDPGTDSADF